MMMHVAVNLVLFVVLAVDAGGSEAGGNSIASSRLW